jgi:hypothetical protein
LKAIKVIAASLEARPAAEFASGGVTRMGGDTGPLKIKEDRGLRGAALRGVLAPGRVRGRQAGRVGTPIPSAYQLRVSIAERPLSFLRPTPVQLSFDHGGSQDPRSVPIAIAGFVEGLRLGHRYAIENNVDH